MSNQDVCEKSVLLAHVNKTDFRESPTIRDHVWSIPDQHGQTDDDDDVQNPINVQIKHPIHFPQYDHLYKESCLPPPVSLQSMIGRRAHSPASACPR